MTQFYAAINHTGHESFGRGGVRVPAYSLAESADALRSALKAVRPDLFFIPLVYTQQFGYGLPGAHVIGAPGGAPFAGTASAAVSFATAAGDGQAGALDGRRLLLCQQQQAAGRLKASRWSPELGAAQSANAPRQNNRHRRLRHRV